MIKVLDHGYIKLVESWGSDERIIEAARMSTDKAFRGWGTPNNSGDEKLLGFLWKHKHATPFEMAGLIIEVKAPIFVFREWHRHRTQSYNEMSARYIPIPNENYVPKLDRLFLTNKKNKQASGVRDTVLDTKEAIKWLTDLNRLYDILQNFYEDGLDLGIPKELARVCLPVGRYSKMRASANLRNWLAFLTLRMDSAAQWEIRQYANIVGGIIKERFPRTWELFAEGKEWN